MAGSGGDAAASVVGWEWFSFYTSTRAAGGAPAAAIIRKLPNNPDPMSDSLTLHRDGAVARLRLDRPQLHNAFDAALIAALTDALALLGADPQVRVVVLEGAGASFSCKGNQASGSA